MEQQPADPRLKAILDEASERRGETPAPRPIGRPRGDNYKPREVKERPALASDEIAQLQSLLIERLRRKIDGLNLYQPMPIHAEFHKSNAKEKLIRGANRSGKTTAAAKEVAGAVTGRDARFPREAGIAYLVGKDGKEVAGVMYKLLFRAGAFWIIRDEQTREWRTYHPVKDAHRDKEKKQAPPLIPARFVKSIAWENKKANLPSLITLHNGWELHFFSSNSLPPHGSQIDLAWFDEEILNSNWYSEIAARLVDRNGRFIWSATPQAGTVQLYELHERAEDQQRLPVEQRVIEEFVVRLSDNEYLTDQQKREFESKLSADDVMVRVHGEFASHGLRVFPEFSDSTHVCPYFAIPDKWTRYIAVDPGRQVCGALFMAVPPPGEDACVYLYEELYIRQCSAKIFGLKMRDKCRGHNIEAIIIDHQEGRKVETGIGRSVEDQYSEALAENGITCNRTGTEFTWGVPDPEGGVEAVRDWITLRGGVPKLRILDGKCPNFIWEMKRYWYERDRDGRVTDKPRSRGPVHLCACVRYLVQDTPVWVEPDSKKPNPGSVWKKAQELMGKNKVNNGTLYLGPGSSFEVGIGAS